MNAKVKKTLIEMAIANSNRNLQQYIASLEAAAQKAIESGDCRELASVLKSRRAA